MTTSIKIKRSQTTAVPTSLDAGELAYTSNGDILFIGSPDSNTVTAISGKRFPGTLTANQALIANSTSGIDKIITANAVLTSIWANGAAGSTGNILKTNGTSVYWDSPVGGSDTQIQFNDNGVLSGDSGFTFNKTTDTVTTNTVFALSTVNAATFSVGTSFVANSTKLKIDTTVGFEANGTIGTAGQILYSNGSTPYWAAAPIGDVTSVTAGNGLSGGGTTGDVTIDVGAGDGITVAADSVAVLPNTGIIANASGVFVNSSYIATISSNNASFLGGTAAASYALLASPTFTGTVTADVVTINGNTTIGSNTSDTVTVNSLVSSNLIASTNNTYHLGNTTIKWAQVHAANVHGITGIFDGNVQVAGDLIVAGNVVTTNVGSLVVGDAKILLAANNPGDSLDIGFSGLYTDGGSTVRHAGLFRDASDNGVFKFFANTTQNLTGNNVVDTGATGYITGTLETYLKSSGLFTNSSVTNISANSTVSVALVANSLSLSSALIGTSGGTGRSTTTNQALLVGNTSNGYNELTLGTDGKVLQSNGSALIFEMLDGGSF